MTGIKEVVKKKEEDWLYRDVEGPSDSFLALSQEDDDAMAAASRGLDEILNGVILGYIGYQPLQ